MEAVRILSNGKVKNGHRTVAVTKRLGESILFVAKGNGGPWTIDFKGGSPFKTNPIEVPKGSYKSSGPLRDDVTVGESYKYSVFNSVGNEVDDPDVDVE